MISLHCAIQQLNWYGMKSIYYLYFSDHTKLILSCIGHSYALYKGTIFHVYLDLRHWWNHDVLVIWWACLLYLYWFVNTLFYSMHSMHISVAYKLNLLYNEVIITTQWRLWNSCNLKKDNWLIKYIYLAFLVTFYGVYF